jgi:hypothetical protein
MPMQFTKLHTSKNEDSQNKFIQESLLQLKSVINTNLFIINFSKFRNQKTRQL